MTSLRAFTLCAVVLLVPRTGSAQMMSNPAQWYINNGIYSSRVFNSAVANSMLTKRPPATSRPVAPAATEVTRFRETTGTQLPSVLSTNSGGIASTPAEARAFFDFAITLYRTTAAKDGFPSNDLAYAFEYFVVNNYQILHDLVAVPYDKDPYARRGRDGFERIALMSEKKLRQVTPDQERAVYEQFRARLADNPAIRRMTDAEKQEAAELMATMFGINFTAYMQGIESGSEAQLQAARDMAKRGLEQLLGVPSAQIRITTTGLELGPIR